MRHPLIAAAALLATGAIAQALEMTITSDGPMATLEQARDHIRSLRKDGRLSEPVTVWIAQGTYERREPFVLEAQDSGTAAAPVIYRAMPGGRPRFVGASVVKGFVHHQGQILKADVRALLAKGRTYRQVLWDLERLHLARYPNFDAKDPLYGGWAFVDEIPPGKVEGHGWNTELYLHPQDVRRWAHPEEVELNIFAQYGWWNFIEHVQSVDPVNRKLTLSKPCSYDLHPHNRFIFQNALEELDSPGEWYLDPRTATLYLWPPGDISTHEVRLVTLGSFVKIGKGASHLTLRGLTFSGCNDTAIAMDNAEHCLVAGCTLTTVGDFHGGGISISGGRDNAAVGNDVSFTGSAGISLSGGDRITLTAANNRADNNHIHHIGVFNKNAAGVGMSGCGNVVSHNLIHDGPRMGVQMSGNNLIVEYNHMHHLVMETQDGGAVYTGGRDWISSRGSVWRYNRIHDIVGVDQEKDGLKHPWFTFGLYPDDNTGGVDIIGNLVYRIAYTPIHLHNSRDCNVENNVFAYGGRFQFDLHGWTKDMHYWKSHGETMMKGYDSVVDQPAWKGMRGMDINPRDAFHEDGTMMSGDVVRRNIMLGNEPGVKYGDLRHCSPQWNTIDYNLAWNSGHPVVTGVNKVGADKGEPVLEEHFDSTAGSQPPKGWGFNHRPNQRVQMKVADGALSVDCALSDDPKNPKSVFHGPDVPVTPGGAYRVRLRVRSSEPSMQISLALASFKNGEGYWQTSGQTFTATTDWQEIETTGRMLRESETGWKPWMKAFWLRIDCHAPKGQVSIDDVRISEAAPLDEWTSWQAEGWDQHGIVADPLFVDPEHDDFRLKPESPAITKLGFKPLPIAEMGLYEDELRASWPVK